MAKQSSAQPRYWVFKETDANPLYRDPKPQQWFVDPASGVKPSDIAYFWREEDSSYFVGWGVIMSEPAAVTPAILESAIESAIEHDFAVQISAYWFPSTPIMRGEMYEDPILKPLSEQIRMQPIIFEINSEQATALNRLIRAHDYTTPLDPVTEFADDQDKSQSEAEPSTRTTLSEVLETYSARLTPLTRDILVLAGRLSNQRSHNRDRLTSSCILFAAAELGRQFKNQDFGLASTFVFEWMNDTRARANRYKKGFSQLMDAADPDLKEGSVSITSSAMKVIETAATLADMVRKETPPPQSGVIHARDLVGALLYRMATNSKMGATRRFVSMDFDLQVFRADYLDKFLNHDLNPDDDLEMWHRVLINLTLPVERAVPRAPSWTKTSVPSIDADIPSLIDDLNIGPEVKGFANIIAARDVKTPLSIGVFGDWGSGKSTFMEQLQAEVNKISEAVRNRQLNEETSFLGNIVQIKFNAWHYAEANLWASLVSHVFENLSFTGEKSEKVQAEKRKQLFLGQLVSGLAERRAAEAEVKTKEVNYEEAKTELEGAKRAQDDARLERLDWITKGVWPLVRDFLVANPQAAEVLNQARGELEKKGLTEEELKRELAASRTTLGQAQLHIRSLLEDPKRRIKVLAILALTIVVPLVLSFLLAWLTSSQTLKDVINGVMPVVTLLSGAFAWWRSKRSKVQDWVEKFERAENQLDDMYKDEKRKYDQKISSLADEVRQCEVDIQKAQQRLDTAKSDVAQTIATLQEMEPARALERFVQERAASSDYRRLLGVIALIRRDFNKLSDMMREQDNQDLRKAVAEILKKDDEQRQKEAQAAAPAAAEQTAPVRDSEPAAEPPKERVDEALKDYRVDRIVLYIDDLDRCPPKQVVDVLQAIHLLLAFELFVVVVGVDARWVRHALRKRFPEMLSEDWDEGNTPKTGEERMAKTATPRDYVEKIFQVPFWLKPMDDAGSKKLLEGLIPEKQLLPLVKTDGRKDVAEQTPSTLPKDQQTVGENGFGKSEPESVGKRTAEASKATAEGDGTTTPREQEESQPGGDGDEAPKKTPFVLKPESLLLDKKERDAMVALSRVIGRTPRTLKRFVNIYRIIKAGLSDEELERFVGTGESDHYRAVLLLLSIAHGAPDVAPDFFLELKLQYDQQRLNKKSGAGFKSFLGQSETRQHAIDPSLEEDWSALTIELERVVKNQKDIPLATLRKWLPVVVRYTFQLGRLSEQVANQDGENKANISNRVG